MYLYLYGFEFPNINYTSLTINAQEEVIFLRLLPYLSQDNPGCFLLFAFQTLFTDLADCSCRCNQYHLRICRVTDLVIQAACTHGLSDDCIRTICHVADLSEALIRHFDRFFVIVIIWFLFQSDLHTFFQKIISEVVFCSCQGDKYFCHCVCSFR